MRGVASSHVRVMPVSVAVRPVSGWVNPLPGGDKDAYKLRGGKSAAQIQRLIVRDATSEWRRQTAPEERLIVQAAMKERKQAKSSTTKNKEHVRAVKAQLAEQKKEYFAAVLAKEQAERDAVKALRLEYHRRKQAVLAEARAELVRVLCEDEKMWQQHPKEMMNKRYRTYKGVHWCTPYN